MKSLSKKTGLAITPSLFQTLHANLLQELYKEYRMDSSSLLDYQCYGFNNYDDSLPSIKKLILQRIGKNVNGKYLYNKYREYQKGVNPIKFNREFIFVYFQTLGYKDIYDFIENQTIDIEKKQEQLQLSRKPLEISEEEFYVGYYLGEDQKIISTKLIISEERSTVTWVLAYPESNKNLSLYTYKGHITHQENCMSFYFRNNENELNRSSFIGIYRDERIKIAQILRGGYCGYSWNGNVVVGEVLFRRVHDKKEQEEQLVDKNVDPIIAQYLRKKRLMIPSKKPYNLSDLSPSSRYAYTMEGYIQKYMGWLVSIEEGIYTMELSILDNSGKAFLKISGYPPYEGFFRVLKSGNVLIGEFKNVNSGNPIYISIDNLKANRYEELIGNLFGGLHNDRSINARIYLTSIKDKNINYQNFNGSELNIENARIFPRFMMGDLEDVFKKNNLSYFFSKSNTQLVPNHIHYIAGNYNLSFINEAKTKVNCQLTIQKDATVVLEYDFYSYKGSCMLSEGSVLCINIVNRNEIPHCGQIINKIGVVKNTLFVQKGSWHYLDVDFIPKVREVEIINV